MMRHLVFTLSQHVLILFSRALVMFLVFILTFAFWLFYGVRIFEKAEPNYHSIGECASYLCTFDLLQLFKLHSCETETTGSFPRLILCSRGIFRPRGRSWRAFVVKHLSLWTPPPTDRVRPLDRPLYLRPNMIQSPCGRKRIGHPPPSHPPPHKSVTKMLLMKFSCDAAQRRR